MKNLTRADISNAIYEKIGLSKTDSSKMLEQIFDIMTDALKKEEAVKIVSFCNFYVKHKKTRVGRNPKTNEEHTITPRKVISFKFSKNLKDEIEKNG
ncbi:MAG: Integration host factor subunit alpha [Alphaproteobacteria bacterium ADurb.Bin438]|nr:MAG: Integration host factor subunit alpha [Alphaproteobacteria bacterium ADurb.Bin438]